MQAIQTIELISQGITDVELLAEIAGDVEQHHFASIKDLPTDIRLVFALNLKGVKEFEEKINLLTIQINKIIDLNYRKDFELLKSIPGFGDKSAQIYLAEVGGKNEIERFDNDKTVAAYFDRLSTSFAASALIKKSVPVKSQAILSVVVITCAELVEVVDKTCTDSIGSDRYPGYNTHGKLGSLYCGAV